MKMAVIVWEYPPKIVGGLGTYAAEITRKFILLDQEISVFTMNDDDGNLPTRELWRGVEIHRPLHVDVSDSLPDVIAEDVRKWGMGGGIQFFSKLLVYNYLSASKIINELVSKEGFQYDIVIAHDWLSAIAGITVKRDLDLPFVFHVHSTEKGRTLGNGSEVVNNIEHRAAQMADMIVTVSNAMKEELIGLGFPQEKIRVCYNGVDPQKYSPDKVSPDQVKKLRALYGVKDNEFMILFVGRLVWIKGVDKLLMAMPLILKEIPNAKLVIVGLGEMKEHYEKIVQSQKLQDSVKFRFEFVPEEERIAHYAACDVAVFPSLYEPFGIVAIEAMSMEKPIVVGATGISGMKEIVISEGSQQCGFHVDPNNPTDIAWGVINSIKDPARKIELGKNGRKRVLENFTWDVIAKKTLGLYDQLLASKNEEKK
jgi:glycosyltransferase involved in cell wall biosynthesis